MKHLDTLIIGGGQAGLCTSYYLTRAGREHLVLEKERIGKAWRDERWDTFTLVTPNRQLKLPGIEYDGFDFSWVQFPIWDDFGYPVQQRRITDQPGLYFVGLHWLHTIKSGLLMGVGDDAAHVVEHIESCR
jgi:cation diffusion facilitator CzcD-associated flavoprotein CzcO